MNRYAFVNQDGYFIRILFNSTESHMGYEVEIYDCVTLFFVADNIFCLFAVVYTQLLTLETVRRSALYCEIVESCKCVFA